MIENILFLFENLNSSKMLHSIRRLLNLLFCLSISSYLYKIIFGQYQWLNFNEYISILEFFINGFFFVPFSILILVFLLTELPAYTLLNPNIKFAKTGIYITIDKYDKMNTYILKMFNTSNEKDDGNKDLKKRIEFFIFDRRKYLSKIFTFVFRLFIAMIFYFINSNNFGLLWFIFLSILSFLAFYIIYSIYRLILLIPEIITKSQELIDNHKAKSDQFNNIENITE